ncbi:hypothetical protein [Mesorhizobium sp.]|uniref:hypothetical protein n=1 Tax=Mesorhizobium sp. TaxID=1871066 RepID=UPI000FE73C96|nr:hypothetical protein [Mesorhizobium sp.]RWO22838.1 MAG: hypothetical protein EOS09_19410 [Mesorhizobium sp.]
MTRTHHSLPALGIAIAGMLLIAPAHAHPATTAAGEPIGENYPVNCCNSAATHPTGDCAPISDLYVTEAADGYHIDLPIGAHPKLITKEYHGIVAVREEP